MPVKRSDAPPPDRNSAPSAVFPLSRRAPASRSAIGVGCRSAAAPERRSIRVPSPRLGDSACRFSTIYPCAAPNRPDVSTLPFFPLTCAHSFAVRGPRAGALQEELAGARRSKAITATKRTARFGRLKESGASRTPAAEYSSGTKRTRRYRGRGGMGPAGLDNSGSRPPSPLRNERRLRSSSRRRQCEIANGNVRSNAEARPLTSPLRSVQHEEVNACDRFILCGLRSNKSKRMFEAPQAARGAQAVTEQAKKDRRR